MAEPTIALEVPGSGRGWACRARPDTGPDVTSWWPGSAPPTSLSATASRGHLRRGCTGPVVEALARRRAETRPWRSFYLTGAKELRHGVLQLPTPNTACPGSIAAMTVDTFLDDPGIDGDAGAAQELLGLFATFELWFNIVEP